MNANLETIIRNLNGLTYLEWVKIQHAVGRAFEIKENGLKNKLALTDEEIEIAIRVLQ